VPHRYTMCTLGEGYDTRPHVLSVGCACGYLQYLVGWSTEVDYTAKYHAQYSPTGRSWSLCTVQSRESECHTATVRRASRVSGASLKCAMCVPYP
jgi:hypothetical protein